MMLRLDWRIDPCLAGLQDVHRLAWFTRWADGEHKPTGNSQYLASVDCNSGHRVLQKKKKKKSRARDFSPRPEGNGSIWHHALHL